MNQLEFGRDVRNALTAGSMVGANRLEQEIHGIVQMLTEKEPLEKMTSDDVIRTVSDLVNREHGYFSKIAKSVSDDQQRAGSYADQAQRVLYDLRMKQREVARLEKDMDRVKKEFTELLKQAELMKREPNGETSSLNPQPNHFTCRLCGCSIGKIQPHASAGWGYIIPRFCPMCGAEVVTEKAKVKKI